MSVVLSNNGVSKLASSLTTGATTLSVTSGEGSRFPSPVSGEWFPVTILKGSGAFEVVRCTARSGDVLTIVRAQEGTAAQSFAADDRVELRLTEAAFFAGGKMRGAINHADTQVIASAATTDIGAATSNSVDISGTTTITALGTISAGVFRSVRFTGALTLTHNGSSLILPGGANIVTAAGDCALFRSLGSGNWVCLDYMPASGKSVAFAFDRANAVGTVLDSGGVPAGSIIETGVINGTRYTKFLDGTLHQFKTAQIGGGTAANGSVFRSLSYDMGAMAITIVGDAIFLPFGISAASGGGWAGQQTFGAAGQWGQWACYTSAVVTGNINLGVLCIGRWKT